MREYHVRFCERLEVKSLLSTLLKNNPSDTFLIIILLPKCRKMLYKSVTNPGYFMSRLTNIILLWLLSVHYCYAEDIELQCFIDAAIELAKSPVLHKELIEFNQESSNPILMERKWNHLKSDSSELLTIINNPATQEIANFITKYSIQGEGFLVGLNGGLVAATEKTTDYYQADENQFIETIKLNEGQAWLKRNVIDKSSSSMLIKIAVPVFTKSIHSKNISASGVLVIGLDEFVVGFKEGCKTSNEK